LNPFTSSLSLLEEEQEEEVKELKELFLKTKNHTLIFTTAILTITGNITEKDRKRGQVLDTLKVERERGET
jgi:hypothetical protein